jgi:hypothetical protein
LKKQTPHYFLFDSYSRLELEELHSKAQSANFIIKATSEMVAKNLQTDYLGHHRQQTSRFKTTTRLATNVPRSFAQKLHRYGP